MICLIVPPVIGDKGDRCVYMGREDHPLGCKEGTMIVIIITYLLSDFPVGILELNPLHDRVAENRYRNQPSCSRA